MRDDSYRWPAFNPKSAPITLDDIRLSTVHVTRQTLMSGPVDAALHLCGLEKAYGWPDIVTGEPYALRLRRDRILVVNGPALGDGWHEDDGLAISDIIGGLHAFELTGTGAVKALQRGTEISLHDPSRSVTRRFFGLPAEIYRHQATDRFRLHVPTPLSASLLAAITGNPD